MSTRVVEETVPGQAGGQKLFAQKGRAYMARIGSRGGKKVLKRYGNQFFQLIGTLGADAVNGHLTKTRKTNIERSIRRLVNS